MRKNGKLLINSTKDSYQLLVRSSNESHPKNPMSFQPVNIYSFFCAPRRLGLPTVNLIDP
jgi:hypothetical protein